MNTTTLVPSPPAPTATSAAISSVRTLGTTDPAAPNAPVHLAACGENLDVLARLEADGSLPAASVDLVYLDPPYNTGNTTFDRYADKYAADFGVAAVDDAEDWVDFMRPRIQAAHRLLHRLGLILVSIGDDEHHRLRLLLDEIFGRRNFVSNIVWANTSGGRNDSRYVSNECEYLVVYARDLRALNASGTRWREPKPGVSDILDTVRDLWDASGHDAEIATASVKAWQKTLPVEHPLRQRGMADYNKVDDRGDLYRYGSLAKAQKGKYHYDLIDPATGACANRHPNGWRMPEHRAAEMIAAGDIVFSADGTQARAKLRLREQATQVPSNFFTSPRGRATAHLKALLGEDRFPYSKDHQVLMRWIALAAPADATIVDFFGGSGSTLEAALRLNAVDGGNRRCVLITNNEVAASDAERLASSGHLPGDPAWEAHGVFEHVTVPRIAALVEGERPLAQARVEVRTA